MDVFVGVAGLIEFVHGLVELGLAELGLAEVEAVDGVEGVEDGGVEERHAEGEDVALVGVVLGVVIALFNSLEN